MTKLIMIMVLYLFIYVCHVLISNRIMHMKIGMQTDNHCVHFIIIMLNREILDVLNDCFLLFVLSHSV